MDSLLVVVDHKTAPTVIPEGTVKLIWLISNPLPILPDSLKILVAPHITNVDQLPNGVMYLEINGNTRIYAGRIPKTCHVEIYDKSKYSELKYLLKIGTKQSWIKRKLRDIKRWVSSYIDKN